VRRAAWLLAGAAALSSAACAPALVTLPSGAGVPLSAADADAALDQATASCRDIRTLTAEIAVSGRVAGQRVRLRLTAGVETPDSVRLEAAAPFGAPIFIFVAADHDATLLLPRDRRVVEHGRPDAVLDAATGVPLDAADLPPILTGCLAPRRVGNARAVQLGDRWRRIADDAQETYLARDSGAGSWRVAAAVRRTWRVDYVDRQRDLPHTIRLTSLADGESAGAAFNLELVLSQIETNVPLEADVFRVKIPADAVPISLDALRRARPGVREN
jgi:hypothetical protein